MAADPSKRAMDDQTKQAFTAASDWAKQILTLSTGIVTLTVAFADKIFGDLSDGERWTLWIAWALYIVAILGGVWVLSALTGTLARDTSLEARDVYNLNTALPAYVQLGSFVAATIAIVIFGFMTAGNERKTSGAATAAVVRPF